MDVFEAIKRRRSIRKYKPKPVPKKYLKTILNAARLAPSAGNRQPWRFVVVRDPEKKKPLAEAANNRTFLVDADALIVAIGDPRVSQRWYDKDPMIAVEHMVLTATALGYGTCWIGAIDKDRVKELLKIPDEMSVIALLPVGVPDETPEARPRMKLTELFFAEEYGNPIKL